MAASKGAVIAWPSLPTTPAMRTGDAVINMRKGKLIATYELKVVLGWEGSAKAAGGAPVSGKITLPYVSEVGSCLLGVSNWRGPGGSRPA